MKITVLSAAAQPQGYQLRLSGGRRGGSAIVSVGGERGGDGGWAEYTGLNPDDVYSLTIAPVGPVQPQARFLDTTPFEHLQRPESRLDTVEGPFHLVLHRGGRRPHLTIADAPPQFGVFFDGTGNQVHNALADPKDNNTPTNVAKLRELYLDTELIKWRSYIDGVGMSCWG